MKRHLVNTGKIAAFGAALVVVAGIAYMSVGARASERPSKSLPSSSAFALSVVEKGAPEEVAALQDGGITLQEYEAAIQRTAACARAAGVTIEMDPGAGLRPSRIGFTAAGSIQDAEAAKSKLDNCRAQFLVNVETTWALQQANVSSFDIQRSHMLLTECLMQQGAEIQDGFFSVDDLNRLLLKSTSRDRTDADLILLNQYFPCRPKVMQELGYTLP